MDRSGERASALRGGLLRAAGYAAGVAAALISTPLLVRHLGTTEYGRYATVIAVVTIVGGITEGGINTVALRDLSARPARSQQDALMRDLFGVRLVLSVSGAALALLFALAAGWRTGLVLGTLLVAAGMVLAVTQTLLACALQSRLRFGWSTVADLGRQLVLTVLIVALVVLGADTTWFFAAVIPAAVVSLVITMVVLRGTIAMRPAFHPRRWPPLLRDTAVFAVAVGLNTLYFRVTLVLMSLLATAAETGYFAVSLKIVEVLLGVPALLLVAALPLLMRDNDDRSRFDVTAARLFELALIAGTLTAVGVYLLAPFAVQVVGGDEGREAVGVLRLQGIALLGAFLSVALGVSLMGLRRNRAILYANVAAFAVAVALTCALAPTFGAMGAAAAGVAAEFVLAATSMAFVLRQSGPALRLREVPVIIGVGVAAAVLGRVINVPSVLQAAVGGAAFLALLAAIGRFPPEVGLVLRRRRRPATVS